MSQLIGRGRVKSDPYSFSQANTCLTPVQHPPPHTPSPPRTHTPTAYTPIPELKKIIFL